MASKGKKFSWNRLITNPIPNFARDDINDVDLSPVQADALVRYQLALPNPRYLDPKSFFIAGITGSESLSKDVYKVLVKHNLILPAPNDQSPQSSSPNQAPDGNVMTVNTFGVTKKFANQLAVISVHAQRKLVGMLFFWEEECTRWNLLDKEEKEIKESIERVGENNDLVVALEAVKMKRTLLPSMRGEGTANVSPGRGYELPRYA
ncbi:hypothetical protein F5884DRAFT_747255 [Xylogone sp. PMI_703]|nr:hypothetical protein F5884DRAFT_747255 [Xylogone sp. PMI_703]